MLHYYFGPIVMATVLLAWHGQTHIHTTQTPHDGIHCQDYLGVKSLVLFLPLILDREPAQLVNALVFYLLYNHLFMHFCRKAQ